MLSGLSAGISLKRFSPPESRLGSAFVSVVRWVGSSGRTGFLEDFQSFFKNRTILSEEAERSAQPNYRSRSAIARLVHARLEIVTLIENLTSRIKDHSVGRNEM